MAHNERSFRYSIEMLFGKHPEKIHENQRKINFKSFVCLYLPFLLFY
ncbi:hypothetical protein LMANV2_330138 [Leptospira interrogans serovar Manilae]|uniref:Uncharacterized protein n=1 Tax=Leptospira interrogans serovar Manilae TaxID=214675 RepID=A0AAQ1NYC5_LEPIR|nr:hypothetical protein LMANV2_330138 [Leptospira interrogans serovar Manilae]